MIQDYIDNFIWQSSRITAKKFFANEGIGYKKVFEESNKFYDYISKNNDEYNGVLSKLNHNNSTILLFLAFRSIKKVEDINNMTNFLFRLYDKVKSHKGQLSVFTAHIIKDNKIVRKMFFHFTLEYVAMMIYSITNYDNNFFNKINIFSNKNFIGDNNTKTNYKNIQFDSKKDFFDIINSIEEEFNVRSI